MTSAPVVVVGSYNRDTSLFVAEFPKAGETIHALGTASSHGGKGSNQAVQAARVGASVSIICCLGCDRAGDDAVQLWKSEGIQTDFVSRAAGASTGSATILIDDNGENCIVVESGANAKLSTADIDRSAEAITRSRIVVAQLEIPNNVVRAAFAQARKGRVLTVLNAAPAPETIDQALLELTDLLVVNEGEARALVPGEHSSIAAAKALVPRVGTGVILTAGARGAVLLQQGQEAVLVRAPIIVPQDTTGAGDALVGAVSAMLAAEWPIKDALEIAVEAGAFACISHGAVSSFGTYAQITGGR